MAILSQEVAGALKKGQTLASSLQLENGWRNHFAEGIIFALRRGNDVHQGCADVLLLEASLKQVGHLGLLKARERGCLVNMATVCGGENIC